ncbi:glycosyltransferase family 2 protein [Sedimenticola sp.]|uniref:glycosyltransferase family 2 protein n=1 Tax=Sedimenticola sp. TaxID=1940285 RepID=UPI003D0AAC9D
MNSQSISKEPADWAPAVSVVLPVYNEVATVAEVLDRLAALPFDIQLVVVDDHSDDGSWELLQQRPNPDGHMTLLRHAINRGKGAAVRTAIPHCRGEVVIVQDADLEYHPDDIVTVVEPFADTAVNAVYGSRYSRANPDRPAISNLANRWITVLSNRLVGTRLSDMAVGYKAVRRSVLNQLELTANGFGFDADITRCLARRQVQILEVPISYQPRGYAEGKKIRWHDFFAMLYQLLRR